LSWAPCRLIWIPLLSYAWEVSRILVPTVLVQVGVFLILRSHTYANMFELCAIGGAIYVPLGFGLALALLRPLERGMVWGEVARVLQIRGARKPRKSPVTPD
jgi:hypothetical protein